MMIKHHRNLHPDHLIKKALKNKEGVLSKTGALIVLTGKYTGRSPHDKFIVDTPNIHSLINWGKTHMPISVKKYERLFQKINRHLASKRELYVYDGFAGADPKYQLHVRVVSELAHQSLFSHHLLRRPTEAELKTHRPQLTILSAPTCPADPPADGTNSEAFVVLNLETMTVLIGTTRYLGEIKKSIFSVMNAVLPQKKILPMHCSANVGKNGDVALFFGLSGTGKTTLSTDPNRKLIGDDEHGWSENGIFNFEGGCYAKCIKLSKKSEPQIFQAIKHGALVENVVLKKDRSIDFDDGTITENTRAAYPLYFIENSLDSGVAGHPRYLIFLTADASGVLPPVARLSTNASIYHFLSGYTSKLAGTERGIKEPKATFSAFFGDPFMPLKPAKYADLFQKHITKYKSRVYLINTGWTGGAYGVGKRISIEDTRKIVSAVLQGRLDQQQTYHDDIFNLDVPVRVPGVKNNILKPSLLWKSHLEYQKKARELAGLFVENSKKFKDIPVSVINSGPKP